VWRNTTPFSTSGQRVGKRPFKKVNGESAHSTHCVPTPTQFVRPSGIEEKCEKLAKQQARFERKLEKLSLFQRSAEAQDDVYFVTINNAKHSTSNTSNNAASSTTVVVDSTPLTSSLTSSSLTSSLGASIADTGCSPPLGISTAELQAKLSSRYERHAEKWLRKEYQLRPDGLLDVELKETMQEVDDDFNLVLGESKSSLKRSLVFVGGIIRGYLRRGRNREFIRTMRRLESRSKQVSEELEEAGLHGLVAPMQAYIAPPRLTINVVRRTANVWDTIAKLWQFRHEQALLERLAAQLYDHAEHDANKVDFYVPQLANTLLQLPMAGETASNSGNRGGSSSSSNAGGGNAANSGSSSVHASSVLERFVIHRASHSIHFALRMFLAVRAALHDHSVRGADDESESDLSEPSELSDSGDAEPNPSAPRRCLWCRKCHALLASIRHAVGAADAALRQRDSQAASSGGRSLASSGGSVGGGGDVLAMPSSPRRQHHAVLNPLPKALRDMRLKVKGSFHGEVDVNVGGVKHWHRHEADVTGNSFSISVDSGSTSPQVSVEKAEWRRNQIGPGVAYFDNQLEFLEKLVTVSRELQATKVAFVHRRKSAGGSGTRTARRHSEQAAATAISSSSSPPSAGASAAASGAAASSAPPMNAELAEVLSSSLRKQLETFTPMLDAVGGVSLPLDDGGKSELPSRLVRFCGDTAAPIATSNRMLFAIDYEQVAAPSMTEAGEFDDVQLRSADAGFALERRRRSSTDGEQLAAAAPAAVASSAALPAVAVVIKQSYASDTTTPKSPQRRDDAGDDAADADDSGEVEAAALANEVLRGAFGVPWAEHVARKRNSSPFATRRGWARRRIIVKYGDSLMQEQLAMQLLRHTMSIFEEFSLDLPLLTYDIVATTAASGVIECVPNAVSLDSLRQRADWTSLADFFESAFGPRTSDRYAAAHNVFVRSNAAYSIVSFVLQIKDRHNANVLLTSSGQLCHIDFGFVLTHTVAFEKAPFKLTEEVVNVMALTPESAQKSTQLQGFALYCSLCVQGYLAVRRRADRLLLLLEMSRGFGRCYPGLDSAKAIDEVRARLHLDWSERQCAEFVLNLVADARDNWRTTLFDSYQQIVNDIN
jgi:hypothetical protein